MRVDPGTLTICCPLHCGLMQGFSHLKTLLGENWTVPKLEPYT